MAAGVAISSEMHAPLAIHVLRVNKITYMCKNITFPQLQLRTVLMEF